MQQIVCQQKEGEKMEGEDYFSKRKTLFLQTMLDRGYDYN